MSALGSDPVSGPEVVPGGRVSHRPLHFFWILDRSGSMTEDGKMAELNHAIRDTIPAMRDAARSNPEAEVLVRCVTFDSNAQWHIATETPVDDFEWSDITADGETMMDKAIELVAEQLRIPPMSSKALPPVLVLMSDGDATDRGKFEESLKSLDSVPWGKKAVRIAIGIGRTANLDTLQKFINNSELKPLLAVNADQLVTYIRWASTAVVSAVSAAKSTPDKDPSTLAHVVIPAVQVDDVSDVVVW